MQERSSVMRRRWVGAALAGPASLVLPVSRARAAIAGGKPVSLVVTYPVGGGADAMARLIAPRMAEALGQPVVVENRPGASGTIAAQHVARAPADGSVIMLDASSFAVNPALFDKLPYDPQRAFTTLGIVAQFPNVLVCSPNFEARSVADVLRLARAKPGALAYASSGNGSAQHLAGALFEQLARVQLLHVPYKGGAPALTDVMGGQVPIFFGNVASSLGPIQSGRLRALAVTSALRCRALPDVPTTAEAGVRGHEVLEWNPVFAPAGVSVEVRSALSAALRHAVADPEVLGRIRSLGGDGFSGDADRFVKQQMSLWGRVVREHGIRQG